MKKADGRNISPKAMDEIRARAVQRVQAGESPEVVIKTWALRELVSTTGWPDTVRVDGTVCVPVIVADALKNLMDPKSNGSIEQFVTKNPGSSNLNLHCGLVR